jgi:ribosomal protein S18 acetylase RimI-like enzyme
VKVVDVRQASETDLDELREQYRSFSEEIPAPEYVDFDLDQELREVEDYVRQHVALVAEREGSVEGFALAKMRGKTHGWISDVYVEPDARQSGIARALLHEAASRLRAQGAETIELHVQPWNQPARAIYERWGFKESLLTLSAPAAELERRLAGGGSGPSRGLVFVQTDDETQVDRAVRTFLPRLGRSQRTDVHPPRNGWIAVDDELCSADPQLLRRLAQELSYRTGAVVLALGIERGAVVRYVLFERGSVADEYASVPEYERPLPPGDVVALSANPTVAHRLAGADPARVRAVARTATSPDELPPADELFTMIADALGVPAP